MLGQDVRKQFANMRVRSTLKLMYLKILFSEEKNIRKEELAKSEKQKGYICLSRVEVRQVQRSSSLRPEGGARTVFVPFFCFFLSKGEAKTVFCFFPACINSYKGF